MEDLTRVFFFSAACWFYLLGSDKASLSARGVFSPGGHYRDEHSIYCIGRAGFEGRVASLREPRQAPGRASWAGMVNMVQWKEDEKRFRVFDSRLSAQTGLAVGAPRRTASASTVIA